MNTILGSHGLLTRIHDRIVGQRKDLDPVINLVTFVVRVPYQLLNKHRELPILQVASSSLFPPVNGTNC